MPSVNSAQTLAGRYFYSENVAIFTICVYSDNSPSALAQLLTWGHLHKCFCASGWSPSTKSRAVCFQLEFYRNKHIFVNFFPPLIVYHSFVILFSFVFFFWGLLLENSKQMKCSVVWSRLTANWIFLKGCNKSVSHPTFTGKTCDVQ